MLVKTQNKPTIISSESKFLVDENDVVVFLLWHLGDIVMSTALLPELSARHNKKLTFVTTRPCAPILENNPYLDKIFIIDLEIPQKVTLEHFVQLKELSQKYFPKNTVYNLHFPIFVPKVYVSAIKSWAKEHSLHFPIYLRNTHLHIVECWAKAIGIEKPVSELKTYYSPAQNQTLKFKLENYFVLGNGASSRTRCWLKTKWNKFVGIMKTKFPDIHLVQLGSKRDLLIDGAEDLRGRTTIEESYLIIKDSLGCLTNDSFMAFLAPLSGCPTFIIYGRDTPRQFRPLVNTEVFVFGGNLMCTPCLRDWCVLSLGLTPCFAFPSVKEVFRKVEEILEARNKKD